MRSASVTPQPISMAKLSPMLHSAMHTAAPASDAQAYTCLVKMYGRSMQHTSRRTPPPTPVSTPTSSTRNTLAP